MHILYLHQYFCPPGGSGNNRSFELAKAWVKMGHEVTVVTSPAYFPYSKKSAFLAGKTQSFELEGIQVVTLPVDYDHLMPFRQRIMAWFKFYRKLMQQVGQLAVPDLIYASSTPLTIGEAGRKLANRWNRPFVFETVDVWPDVPIGMGIVKNRLLINWLNVRTRKIYKAASAVVALSEGMRDQILSHQVPSAKVYVVHNGTDPEVFPFVDRTPGPQKAFTEVLYTGTVGIANGVDQLVRAAKKLEEKGREDIRITILGGGNDLERVKGIAEKLKPANLRFLDRVPKERVPELLAKADIGVVCFAPYAVLEANSANKFYDYLASGLPVIINYQGWQAKYLEEWKAGLFSPQGDEEAFVENLIRLTDAPEERLSMGRKGRELALFHFDRQKLAGRLIELFETILR